MGIYDRGYYRDDPPPGFDQTWNGKSPVSTIVIVCVACFLLNLFKFGDQRLSDLIALHTTDLWQPWMWWRMLTYGFAHASVEHIFFNMFSLWMLGRAVEERYGWNEFWRIYLVSVVFCGFVYLVLHNLVDSNARGSVVGASGAVLAVTMLFVFNYPRNTLMFFGILPIPAWGLGLIIVLGNLMFLGSERSRTAYDVHLAGIAFAAMYFYSNFSFNLFGNVRLKWKFWKRQTFGPKLKAFDADDADNDALEADRILEKIQQSGMDSLTSKERKFMERYSAKIRQKQT